jgi:spermidine synthase
MVRKVWEIVQPWAIACMLMANGWLGFAYASATTREKEQNMEIQQLKQTICTKTDMKEMLGESFDVHFNQFEIYLQDKYRITPKK